MRRTDTRDRILQAALRLFSERGYEAVGVDEIAAAVGIKPPSIYSHFKGKQELVDTLISNCEARYAEQSMLNMKMDDVFLAGLTEKKLSDMVCQHISYLMDNENHKNVTRMLNMGQYSDERMKKLVIQHKYEAPISFGRNLAEGLKRIGRLNRTDDIEEAAWLLVAPIMFFVQQCDLDETMKKDIRSHVERHIRCFWQLMC
ncbi:TetR/AcrR family transcriptional regulator [Anaerovibrio sp.]|uniref:TetR/AcrR family transcriptional regulator n=1 Tax=Anaerovibrio sp. TaxID=1872532 RepID=UPI003F191B17